LCQSLEEDAQASVNEWRVALVFKSVSCQLCLLSLVWGCYVEGSDATRSRAKFVEALNRVEQGMSEVAVLSSLGRPDNIVVENAPDGSSVHEVAARKTWRYGVAGNPPIATLGEVRIDRQHEVANTVGQGTPLPEGMFREEQIRVVLDVLNHVRFDVGPGGHDPRPLICAVNLLQPLGKQKALAAIDEFLRIDTARRNGSLFVLRTLFDVPAVPGYMPGIYGEPDPRGPLDPKLLPRFPITLEGDIPFLLIEPMEVEGQGPLPEKHVAYFREFGKLRSKRLIPTDRPLAVLNELTHSKRWYGKGKNRFTIEDEAMSRRALYNQTWRLLGSVLRYEEDPCNCASLVVQLKEWTNRLEEVSKLRIQWNNQRCEYTFTDGTTLPAIRHTRLSWKPSIPGLSAEITVERANPTCVEIGLHQSWQAGTEIPSGIIKVYDVKAMEKPLCEFRLGRPAELVNLLTDRPEVRRALDASKASHAFEGGSGGVSLCLKQGTEIQAELRIGKTSQRSAVFKP
jgi:hypothetical protein